MTPEDISADPKAVAAIIDHTLLKPDAMREDVALLCQEAREFSFASVCLNSCWVSLAESQLSGSAVRICTVVGFPLGANESLIKTIEADMALSQGATELDMVINIGWLRSGEFHPVQKEIAEMANMCHSRGAILKVILETCLLSDEEKTTACRLAAEADADYVKTSTGFSKSGATVEDVALMRSVVGSEMGVKASGGVRTLDALTRMVRAGANRIGTSSGVAIVREIVQASAHPNSMAPRVSAY